MQKEKARSAPGCEVRASEYVENMPSFLSLKQILMLLLSFRTLTRSCFPFYLHLADSTTLKYLHCLEYHIPSLSFHVSAARNHYRNVYETTWVASRPWQWGKTTLKTNGLQDSLSALQAGQRAKVP